MRTKRTEVRRHFWRWTLVSLIGLAGCATKSGAIQTFSVPLYPTRPDTRGMEPVSFAKDAPGCQFVRYHTGKGKYAAVPKPDGVTQAFQSSFDGRAEYGEALQCYCYSSEKPETFTHGTHRMHALSQMREYTAGEMKIKRDTYFKTDAGARYEFEGELPYAGKVMSFYAARSMSGGCSVGNVAIWDPRNEAAAAQAFRFIAANSDWPQGAAPASQQSTRGDAEARLRLLEKLRSDGLVTESEYQTKRAEILRGL